MARKFGLTFAIHLVDSTSGIEIFITTVELGTFAAVGQRLGMTASAIARTIGRLEKQLGAKLLHRSTRHLTLTQEGESFLPHARSILLSMRTAQSEIAIKTGSQKGLIRVNSGTAFWRHRLREALPTFLMDYPEISIDMVISDHRIDPIKDQFDITIRVGPLDDSSLIMHRLGVVNRTVLASPSYLERHGMPKRPSDLLEHNCLLLSGFPRLSEWPMFENGTSVLLRPTGSVKADNADVLIDLAISGVGIVRVGDFLGEKAIADGLLVPLLEQFHDKDQTILSALILPGRQNIPRVRSFISFLSRLCMKPDTAS